MSNGHTLVFLELSTTQSSLRITIYGKLQKVPIFSFVVQNSRNSLSKISLGIFEFLSVTEIFKESQGSNDSKIMSNDNFFSFLELTIVQKCA